MWDRAARLARQAHNLKVVSSNLTPATFTTISSFLYFLMNILLSIKNTYKTNGTAYHNQFTFIFFSLI